MQAHDSDTSSSIVTWVGNKGDVEHERLRSALLDAERRMLDAKRRGIDIAACLRCLTIALADAAASRFYAAWDNIHQFDVQYLAMLDEEGRRIAWCEMSAEAAEKLAGWRAKAVATMTDSANAKQPPSAQMLVAIREQLARQSQNYWLKRAMIRRRVPIVLCATVAMIVAMLATAEAGWYESLVPGIALPLRLGMLAAVLGAVISVAISAGSADTQIKIPHLGFAITAATLRPAVGALCAIPVVFLVHSGFLQFGGLSKLWTSMVLCLITGFSERWFLGLMERVTAGAKT